MSTYNPRQISRILHDSSDVESKNGTFHTSNYGSLFNDKKALPKKVSEYHNKKFVNLNHRARLFKDLIHYPKMKKKNFGRGKFSTRARHSKPKHGKREYVLSE